MFDILFPLDQLPTDFDREAAKKTFLIGGFYTHHFSSSKTTLIALNSMFWKIDNECEFIIADY